MPTYEFKCPAGHEFEKFYRKISDSVAELPCPVCGLVGARQMSAGAGLVFKGSGFYITDYGKDGKKGQAGAKSDSGTDGNSKGSEGKGSEGKGSDGKESGGKGSEGKGGESSSGSGKAAESGSSAGESKSGSSDAKPATGGSTAPKKRGTSSE